MMYGWAFLNPNDAILEIKYGCSRDEAIDEFLKFEFFFLNSVKTSKKARKAWRSFVDRGYRCAEIEIRIVGESALDLPNLHPSRN